MCPAISPSGDVPTSPSGGHSFHVAMTQASQGLCSWGLGAVIQSFSR